LVVDSRVMMMIRRKIGYQLPPTAIRNPKALILTAVIALGLASVPLNLQAGSSKDLWQSDMLAAQAADAIDDFTTEALVLANALSLAKGQRRALSRLPLVLAYLELGRKDLWQPIAKEDFQIDVNPPEEMRAAISFLDRYGWNYYNRWKTHRSDTSEDPFKQTTRLAGAENAFRMEVALREKLMSDDEAGLGEAQASLGLVLSRESPTGEIESIYSQALQHLRSSNMKLAAMDTLSELSSMGDPARIRTERNVGETQISVLILTANNLIESAQASLREKNDDQFASQAARAQAIFQEISDLTASVRQGWPRHSFFGLLESEIGWLHQTEFEVTRIHPDRYPDSFAKAKNAFEQAIAIYEYSKGPNSPELRNVAGMYIALLKAANQADAARKLAQRYGLQATE
jgi:hypothetical protein